MGNTRQVVDGEEKQTLRPLRPAAPGEGAQSGSGVAAGGRLGPVPRPRRPWLQPPTDEDAEPARSPDANRADEVKPSSSTDSDPTDKAKPANSSDADSTGKAKPASSTDTDTDTDTDADSSSSSDSDSDAATPERAARTGRRRVRFAHAIRVSPARLTVGAARSVHRWSRRPSGQLTLPGGFLLLLVAATVAAGALLVPTTVGSGPDTATTDDATAAPGGPPPAGTLAPPDATTAVPPPGLGRPADTLAGWAAQTGPKVGIAPVALQAYGYAELVLAQTNRSCGLSWTTLAAIGHVESGHGQANNAQLGSDGRAAPEIIGLPLDGQGGRMLIRDTDRGTLDQDATYDRAVGPMQFIPTTWQEIGADADNDGRKDPHDIDDAALAAANYLCKGGRNLTTATDWWNAVLSYNDVRQYAQDVFDKANQYGQASRS